jgi:hypothetical protein
MCGRADLSEFISVSTEPTEKKDIQKLSFGRPFRDTGYPERVVQRAYYTVTPMSAPGDIPKGSPVQNVTLLGHLFESSPAAPAFGPCWWAVAGCSCRAALEGSAQALLGATAGALLGAVDCSP